jgi:hypothetical protein
VKIIIYTIFDWFGFHQLLFGLEFSSEEEKENAFRMLCLCSVII